MSQIEILMMCERDKIQDSIHVCVCVYGGDYNTYVVKNVEDDVNIFDPWMWLFTG